MTDPRIDELLDRIAAQDLVTELFLATDLKAWDRVTAVFADEVHFDMTSLTGGEPVKMTPDGIAGTWEDGLTPVTAVHHQIGNFTARIDGDSADVSCYGTATHYHADADKLTHFVGTYDFHLVRAAAGWRIDSFRFNSKYVD